MKLRKSLFTIIAILMISSMLLAACGSTNSPTSEAPVATQVPPDTELPTATVEMPTEVPVENPDAIAILPTAAAGEAALTANQNLRIRSGPGAQFPVYKFMIGGSTARLVGISADSRFYAIDIPLVAPAAGWVEAQFATVTNADELPVLEAPPVPPTADFTPVEDGQPLVSVPDAVFVRSGPGQNFPSFGIAQEGARGLLLGVSEDNLWWVVRADPNVVGRGYAWVMKEFVTAENVPDDLVVIKTPDMPVLVTLPPPDPNGPFGTATEFINVRSGPGTNFPSLRIAAPGSSAVITGRSADGVWWQFRVDPLIIASGLAWAHSSFVQVFNVENIPVVESPPAPPANPAPPVAAPTCLLIAQSPADGSVVAAGSAFQQTWEVENIGSTTWTGTTMIRVGVSGEQALSAGQSFTLNDEIRPGFTKRYIINMTAPNQAGTFGETWAIQVGGVTACNVNNLITVQK